MSICLIAWLLINILTNKREEYTCWNYIAESDQGISRVIFSISTLHKLSMATMAYKVIDAFRLCNSPKCAYLYLLVFFSHSPDPFMLKIVSSLQRSSIYYYSSCQNQVSSWEKKNQKIQSDLIMIPSSGVLFCLLK